MIFYTMKKKNKIVFKDTLGKNFELITRCGVMLFNTKIFKRDLSKTIDECKFKDFSRNLVEKLNRIEKKLSEM